MRQTLALFVDAYRELNARKLFWVTLLLSGVVVAVFAAVGINDQGLSVLWWTIEVNDLSAAFISPEFFYKGLFVYFGIGFWLAFVAVILALVSTSTIFPDLVSSGSIDLMLSKPISRLRLFLTKYLTGLLFVVIQVTVFSVAAMLVIGLRGGSWEPALLLAIPVITVFYSYLFSICALLGVLTRSALASLLLTLLVWFLIFIVHSGESVILFSRISGEVDRDAIETRIASDREALESRRADSQSPDPDALARIESRILENEQQLAAQTGTIETLETVHTILFSVKTILPKTSETVGLLERWLIDMADLPELEQQESQRQQIEVQRRLTEILQHRSVWWIAGTSFLFECVMLAIGAWVFNRRDF